MPIILPIPNPGLRITPVRITYANRDDLSYHVLNLYEPIPGENNTWGYYEYGKVLRYVAQEELLGAEYRGFLKKNEALSKIDFTLGFEYRRTDKQEKVFPADYSQKLHLYDYYGAVNKHFEAGRSLIRLNLCGGYAVGTGDPLRETNPLTSGSLTLNKSLLARDYAFRTGSNYRIGGGLTYAYKINPQRGQTLSLGVHYLCRKLLDVKDSAFTLSPDFSGFGNNRRNYLNVQIGFSF